VYCQCCEARFSKDHPLTLIDFSFAVEPTHCFWSSRYALPLDTDRVRAGSRTRRDSVARLHENVKKSCVVSGEAWPLLVILLATFYNGSPKAMSKSERHGHDIPVICSRSSLAEMRYLAGLENFWGIVKMSTH